MDTFDYVVVGGGSAGSVVAARLVEAGHSVCVLEAGPSDAGLMVRMPGGFVKVAFDPRRTWGYHTEANAQTGIRSVPMIQGRMLGGGSSVNGMVYTRGQAADFDHWAQLGNRGWSHDDVLPYFRRSESRLATRDPSVRGSNGPLTVSDLEWPNALVDAFVDTVVGLGAPRNPDYNGVSQEGAGTYQYTIGQGGRMSASRAFLRPLRKRPNLSIRTGAHVTRILFEGRRAVGVAYRKGPGAAVKEVRARRELILCAGAINTPRLLQVSGVASPSLLQEIGVELVHALPGVGENLQDHFAGRMTFRVHGTRTINQAARCLPLLGELARWVMGKPSVVGMGVIQGAAFLKSRRELDTPDYVLSFTAGSLKEGIQGVLDDKPGMTIGYYQLRPESRGHVRARSGDPFDAPLVQPNYLQASGDGEVMLAAMRSARRVAAAQPLARFRGDEILPGEAIDSDDELMAFARERGTSGYHVCGTCRMGPESDPAAVVDPQLRVRGLEGLRIADASIMPTITSGNTNAPTIMIAEKAADLILGRSVPSNDAQAA